MVLIPATPAVSLPWMTREQRQREAGSTQGRQNPGASCVFPHLSPTFHVGIPSPPCIHLHDPKWQITFPAAFPHSLSLGPCFYTLQECGFVVFTRPPPALMKSRRTPLWCQRSGDSSQLKGQSETWSPWGTFLGIPGSFWSQLMIRSVKYQNLNLCFGIV